MKHILADIQPTIGLFANVDITITHNNGKVEHIKKHNNLCNTLLTGIMKFVAGNYTTMSIESLSEQRRYIPAFMKVGSGQPTQDQHYNQTGLEQEIVTSSSFTLFVASTNNASNGKSSLTYVSYIQPGVLSSNIHIRELALYADGYSKNDNCLAYVYLGSEGIVPSTESTIQIKWTISFGNAQIQE